MPVISHTSPSWNRIPIVGKSHFVGNIAVCLVYNFFWCHTIFLYAWCARMESNHHPRFRRPVYYPLYYGRIKLAEVVGFEPTDPFEPSVFKTAALSHAQPYFLNWCPRWELNPHLNFSFWERRLCQFVYRGKRKTPQHWLCQMSGAMFGVAGQIWTDGFTDLQSVAMGLSATAT